MAVLVLANTYVSSLNDASIGVRIRVAIRTPMS